MQVCGTDGVTYSSEGDLIVARCEKGKKIGLNYRGPCLGMLTSDARLLLRILNKKRVNFQI